MMSRPLTLLVFLLAFGLFFGYVHPTWNGKIADTKAAIAANDEALLAARAYQAREEELVQKFNMMESTNLDKLENLLPDSVDNVSLILALKALADRSGLALSSIDVSKQALAAEAAQDPFSLQAVNPVNSVDMALTAVGTYRGFQGFLAGIEGSERLLDVKSVSVTGSNTGLYNYQITLRLYWLR